MNALCWRPDVRKSGKNHPLGRRMLNVVEKPDRQTAGHALELSDVSHSYGGAMAVEGVHLSIGPGDFISLLGPSGCGKTTLLRIVAGFVEPTSGEVLLDGISMRGVPPSRRKVGIVFQNYALFPHMTIYENVAYGLRARKARESEVRARVGEMLDLVQLGHLAERYPSQLSGGQQQRVALARAMAIRPSLLLLDEPLSALDKNLRLDMQIEIKRMQRNFGITTIMVTHDQQEAMTMSDRIAVLENGRVQQFAEPTSIYDRPSNMFVNSFIGSTNILPVRLLERRGERVSLQLRDGTAFSVRATRDLPTGSDLVLSVRPEALRFAADGEPAELVGSVIIALPLGPSTLYDIALPSGEAIKVEVPRETNQSPKAEGDKVGLVFKTGSDPLLFTSTEAQT